MTVSVKIVVGAAMAFVVAVVAAVTLAITYTVSVNAVHSAGTNLASSYVDTVGTKVTGYMNVTQDALTNIQTAVARYPGYMVPIQDPQSPNWYQKWTVAIRMLMATAAWDYSNLACIMDDGGLVVIGTWWVDESWAYGYVLDGASIPSTGLTTLRDLWQRKKTTMVSWDNTTMGTGFYPDTFRDQRSTTYYGLKSLTNSSGKPIAVWSAPSVNTFSIATGDFVIYATVTYINASGAYLGYSAAGRRLVGIDQYLKNTATTPNTVMFIVDNKLQLLSSTYPVNVSTFYGVNNSAGAVAGKNGCVTSGASPTRPERIGCRAFATAYPYGPLNSIAKSDPVFLNGTGRRSQYGDLDGTTYFYISQRIPSTFGSYFMNLVLFMPESDVLGDIVTGRNIAIGVSVAVFVVAVLFTSVLLQAVLSPLDDVTARMYRMANLDSQADDASSVGLKDDDDDFSDYVAAPTEKLTPMKESSMTEIRALQVAYDTMSTAIKSFTRYVPRDVVKELVATNQICEIAMRPTNCSIMFSDIRGFTTICEKIPPHMLSRLIKLYFERLSRIVMGHGGTIDKFIGDCIMAVWGAPVPIEKHELRAAVCGRMLVYETMQDPLKSAFTEVQQELAIRVGVATGEVLAGNMGSMARMNYTVIGDDVNLASRLEALNKYWGTNNMISETTALECQDWLVMRHVVTIAVVGKDQPVSVYEVIGVRPNADTEVLGAIGDASSENRTMTETHRDREREELAQIYIKQDQGAAAAAAAMRPTVGKLLRRSMKKVPVSEEEIAWAQQFSAAVAKYERRDFAACMEMMRGLQTQKGGQTNDVALGRFVSSCEEYLRAAPGPTFDGSWKADSK